MAAPLPPLPNSRCERSVRSRPNLVKACKKTKMCSFHLRGECNRAGECSFAHDISEIQATPDLRCTKMCPGILKSGECLKRGSCKFAHSEAELQGPLNLERSLPDSCDSAVKASSHSSSSLSSILSETEAREVPHDNASLPTSFAQPPGVTRTDPRVVARMSAASDLGALTLSEMVLHLTSIFMTIYQTSPQLAERIGVTASNLASVTVEQVWSDAGLRRDASMTFGELARFCALPSVQTLTKASGQQSLSFLKTVTGNSTQPDSDTLSQGSTEEGGSDCSVSFGRCRSPSGSEGSDEDEYNFSEDTTWTLHKPAGPVKVIAGVEVAVHNTFLHFREYLPTSSSRHRACSAPGRSWLHDSWLT